MLSAERIGAQSGPVPPAWRVIGEWYYICTNDCKMHLPQSVPWKDTNDQPHPSLPKWKGDTAI